MIENKNNSVIFKDPFDTHIFDLSYLGIYDHIDKDIEIMQENHYFKISDVIYYDIKKKCFSKAIANNNIESEVCGVVSEVVDLNTFKFKTYGLIETDKYKFDNDTPLYLSESAYGKLNTIMGTNVVKQIATQTSNGIIIDIQRGYRTEVQIPQDTEYELYTQDELDEIIQNVW